MMMRDGSRGRSGQTIYQLLLIMSAVALAIAAFFPAFEYFQSYRGPMEGGGSSALRPGVVGTPSAAEVTTTTMTPGETTSTTLPEAAPETPAAPAEGGGA